MLVTGPGDVSWVASGVSRITLGMYLENTLFLCKQFEGGIKLKGSPLLVLLLLLKPNFFSY